VRLERGSWLFLSFPYLARPGACAIIIFMDVNVLIDEEFAQHISSDWLRNIAEQVLTLQGVSAETEVGLVITSQERVQALNENYLGKDTPTDVLAFHMQADVEEPSPFVLPPDGVNHLGEVIISYPQAAMQANEQGHPVSKEIAILTIHGILHLLGYEDRTPQLRQRMITREQEILSRIKLV